MIEYFIGAGSGIKAANGKVRPKYGIGGVLTVIANILLIIGFCFMFFDGIMNTDIAAIISSAVGIFALGYLLSINAYAQRSDNYSFEFETNKKFALSYKGKPVLIKHTFDKNGKVMFSDDSNKLNCISYADGSYMSKRTKYKILNYSGRWLSDNNVLSDKVTFSVR